MGATPRSSRMKAAAPPAGALLALALALILPSPAGAQAAAGGLDDLYARAKEAISQDAYETAVRILTQAERQYPDAPKVNIALADLYYDKELYTLALEEYLQAEGKGANDFATLTQVSRCYGKLNQDRKSVEYLVRILAMFPDSSDTVDDLGWMYFKTHQLDKGAQVLREGIARLGMNRGMAMTLGTVYSAMNDYAKSREYYLKSIDEALGAGDSNFASIAYYNLSLLEHKFFNYNSALRFTERSIAMEDRPSGHLARGELFESRMDFASAQEEYEKAYAKDTTPLSKVNLAILSQRFGRLELARRYAEEVLASKDLAWMLYYGTDVTRHLKDIHELLADIYQGLARIAAGKPTAGIRERIGALLSSVRFSVLSWYNRQLFRSLSLKVGGEYLAEGSVEDAYWEFYKGNDGYPEVAMKYLNLARALETARTPRAEFFYLQEEGKVRGSAEALERSMDGFDPFWEKDATAASLRYLAPLLKGKGNEERRRQTIERLWEIDRGAVLQSGLGLPLSVEFLGAGWGSREKGLISRYLRRAGSECAEGLRFALRLARGAGGTVTWTLVDSRAAAPVAGGTAEPREGVKTACARLVQSILDELYTVH